MFIQQPPNKLLHKWFVVYISSLDFKSIKSNNYLFTFSCGNDINYLPLYMDDIILNSSCNPLIWHIISGYHMNFPCLTWALCPSFWVLWPLVNLLGCFIPSRSLLDTSSFMITWLLAILIVHISITSLSFP